MAQLQMPIKGGILIRCYNCHYTWRYKGNLLHDCCPSCRHNTRIAYGMIEENSNPAPSGAHQTKDRITNCFTTAVIEGADP